MDHFNPDLILGTCYASVYLQFESGTYLFFIITQKIYSSLNSVYDVANPPLGLTLQATNVEGGVYNIAEHGICFIFT